MSMWEPFTLHAQRSIVLAQEEARRLRSSTIGTEHILLGIVAEGEGAALNVLAALGVDASKIRSEVEAGAEPKHEPKDAEMAFSPRAKRAIELAFEEARLLNYNYIGTGTLLLGVIRETGGSGAQALRNLGVDDADAVRARAVSLLSEEDEPRKPTEDR